MGDTQKNNIGGEKEGGGQFFFKFKGNKKNVYTFSTPPDGNGRTQSGSR